MKIRTESSYYTDCLEAALDDGIKAGNYLNAIADRILHNAQMAIGKDMMAFDVLASARGRLRRETPNNPYFDDICTCGHNRNEHDNDMQCWHPETDNNHVWPCNCEVFV